MGVRVSLLAAISALVLLAFSACRSNGTVTTTDSGSDEHPTRAEGRSEEQGGPRRIASVNTWSDLRRQPSIELENAGEVHLGVESRRVPRWSGVLIYVLVERTSGKEETSGTESSGFPLGPLRIRNRRPGQTDRSNKEIARKKSEQWAGPALFARSIGFANPGRHHLQVRKDDGTPVARATITVDEASEASFHRWAPFDKDVPPRKTLQSPGDSYDASSFLANPARGIAVPAYPGLEPLITNATPDRMSGRLPSLWPRKPDTDVRLSLHEGGLLMKSDDQIILSRPHWHFLTRWWVNGEPWQPGPIEGYQMQNGMHNTGHSILIDLAFHHDRLGAAPGDRVGVQLLYHDGGWRFVTPHAFSTLHATLDEFRTPRMTNRLEFRVGEEGTPSH